MTRPAARSVARSVTAGRPARSCSVSKRRATGPTSPAATRAWHSRRSLTDTNVDAFGLFTGQVGYAINNVLLYVKGGAAVTSNTYRVNNFVGGALAGVTGDDTRWGGTIGAGLEYAFAPNWSVGVEYNHLFMQDRTSTFTIPGGAFFGTDRIRQDVDLVTARLNYRFGGPASSQVLICYLITLKASKPRHRPGLFVALCSQIALSDRHAVSARTGDCTCSGRTPRPTNRAVMPCSQGTAVTSRITSGAFSG